MHLNQHPSISKLISHLTVSRFLVLTFISLSFLPSCQNKQQNGGASADINSKFADYITSYTSGVVSVIDPIKIILAENYGDSLMGQEVNKKIFSFSPAIDGNTYWQDNRTLIFQPTSNLKNNRSYTATLNLKILSF